ncbi:MAG: WD40 repeat domain-containing serine/threonine protein kinase, partial [Gemmatimonas sp.]
SGEADGFLFFVMPYVKGQSLRERLAREGELPINEAVRLIMEVVDALTEAHAHGVVHRDIKPDNVMLSGRHALVTDFGVAKAVSEATGRNTITTLGVALGTPTYMSPEQAAADPHVDHRSDIYSVGVMAYEMLSGRPPFTGATQQQILAAHITEAPDSVSKRRESIPLALEQIVMRCLAKRPADRFQSASELYSQLEPLVVSSTGITPVQMPPTKVKRSRVRMAIGVGAMTAAIVAAVVFVRARTTTAPTSAAIAPIQLTFTGRAYRPILSPNADQIAYFEAPDCAPEAKCRVLLVVQETSPRGTRHVIDSGEVRFDAWSPDGRRILLLHTENDQERHSVNNVSGDEVVHSINGRVAWTASPDSIFAWDSVATHDTVWVRTLETASGAPRDSFPFAPAREIFKIRASPDGHWLLLDYAGTGANADSLTVLTSRSGKVLDTIPRGGFGGVNEVSWGRRSDRVYTLASAGGTFSQIKKQHIDRNGKRVGAQTVVAQASMFASLEGDAFVSVDFGAPQMEFWTADWADGRDRAPKLRLAYKTTAQASGGISYDGESLYIYEQRGIADSAGRQITIPFAGGAPSASAINADNGTPALSSSSGDELMDGSVSVEAVQENGKTVLRVIDKSAHKSARELATTFAGSGQVIVVSNSQFIWRPKAGSDLIVLDGRGAIERRLHWPDSLEFNDKIPTPDHAALIVVATRTFGSKREQSLYRLSLTDGGISLFAGPLPPQGRSFIVGPWSSDGWLPLDVHTTGSSTLMRVSWPAGKIVDDGASPLRHATLTYSFNRLRASAMLTRRRNSDIMFVRNFDPDDR